MIRDRIRQVRKDTTFTHLLRDSGLLYAGGAVSVLLTAAQQISTAGWLGASGYGRLATVLGSAALIFLVVDVRTWELATKVLARPIDERDHQEVARTVWLLVRAELALGIGGAVVLVLAARPVAVHLLHDPHLDGLVRLYAIAIPARMLATGAMTAILRMYGRYGWLSIKSVAYAALRLIAISGAAGLGWGVRGAVAAALIAELTSAVALASMARVAWLARAPDGRWFDLRRPRSVDEVRRLMPTLWISASLKALQLETFIPITALMASPADVGLLRLGIDIADTTSKAVAPLTLVLFPSIVAAFERGPASEALRLMKRGTTMIACIVVPLCLFVLVIAPSLYQVVFDQGFDALAPIASILIVGFTFNALALTLRPALLALGAVPRQNRIGAGLVLLSLIGLTFAARTHHALGSATVMSGFLISYTSASYVLFRRSFRAQSARGQGAVVE